MRIRLFLLLVALMALGVTTVFASITPVTP